jgi:hypothetical protein
MVMSGITFDTIDARDKRLETRVSVAELAVIDGYAASFGFRTRGRYLRQVALNPETGGQAMQPVTAALAEVATALYQLSDALKDCSGWPERDRTVETLNRADRLFAQIPELLRERP